MHMQNATRASKPDCNTNMYIYFWIYINQCKQIYIIFTFMHGASYVLFLLVFDLVFENLLRRTSQNAA